jgi:clan AA aspartic protease
MSLFYYPLAITGPKSDDYQIVNALVDTGATFTVIPSAILHRLGITPTETARFRMADGTATELPLGETDVRIEGRIISTTVVFGEDSETAMLGVYTLERALLAVDPVGQRLIPTDGLLI